MIKYFQIIVTFTVHIYRNSSYFIGFVTEKQLSCSGKTQNWVSGELGSSPALAPLAVLVEARLCWSLFLQEWQATLTLGELWGPFQTLFFLPFVSLIS